MKVFVCFEFDDGEAAGAIEGEQVKHATVADRNSRDLRTEQIAAQAGEKFGELRTQARLKPSLRLHAIKRIGVCAVRTAALK